MSPTSRVCDACLALLIVMATSAGLAAADQAGTLPANTGAAPLGVVCAPDRPVAEAGESVTIRAWVTDASGRPASPPLVFTWSASIGTLSGGEVATWSFASGDAGPTGATEAKAQVLVRHGSLGRQECALRLYLAHARPASPVPPRGPERLASGRAFLLPSDGEPAGYGLYSYLLFDAPPGDDAQRTRYLNALEAYLQVLPPMEQLERYRRRSQLNLILVPVKRPVERFDDLVDARRAAQAAADVLAMYDYARAKALFAHLGQDTFRSGPYLISRLPAAADQEGGRLRLLFDMSHISPPQVRDWVRAFCALSAQERSRNQVALTKLGLHTRNVIAVGSQATPEVLTSLQRWIQILQTR